ncbi:MAG: hypothetical protein IPK78_15380 [Rhodospirillales bacterium]|nr:hypothetical protein [Rhodospirillales bacterium]
MDHGIAVLAIDRTQLDRFRDRFPPACAEDDHRDAQVTASVLRHERPSDVDASATSGPTGAVGKCRNSYGHGRLNE